MLLENYVTTGKLNAFDQLNLARKLGPALPIIDGLVTEANAGKDKGVLTVLILSQLNDADSNYVVKKCLSIVARKQADGSLARLTTADGVLLFDDISMKEILDLTSKVIDENIGDFLRTALSGLQ